MTIYSAESFYRAQIKESILETTAVPFDVTLSVLPTLTNGLLTISPNTEYEEVVEYNNPDDVTMTITIIKRGIKPSSILLTTNWTDYNNATYYRQHTQNDVIRGDVNHIHINQGIGNSTLATNSWVGISKLSVAAVDAGDPIVVGNNDPRLSYPFTFTDGNGLVWTVTNPTTNATLEVWTDVSWMVKADGTWFLAATQWVDYYKPTGDDVVVNDGGTGKSSFTEYAPVFWWTTTTGPLQSGTVGTTWQVLKSNGPWALPTFETVPGFVTNGTYWTKTVGAGPSAITTSTSTSFLLPNITVGRIVMGNDVSAGSNAKLQSSPDNSSWSDVYTQPTAGTSSDFSFLMKEGLYYRVQASTTISASNAAATATLYYTI